MIETGYASEATEPHRDRIKRALRNKRRLHAIEQVDVLDAAHTMPALNRAVRVAAHALRVPIVQLNVLTDKALVPIAVHVEAGEDANTWKMERQAGSSYCKFVIWKQDVFQVDDARSDPLVRQRHATRDLAIGAYLAVPIRVGGTDDRDPPIIGTLCAIDHVPREWSAQDVELLTDIAAGTSEFIVTRGHSRSDARGVARLSDRVLEATAVGVLATDARGVITYVNPAATRLLGYSVDEMHGRDQHALIHHSHADGRKYHERNCPVYLARSAGQSSQTTNDTFWRGDGTPITVDSTMMPVFERGELVGTVLSFVDVTERRSLEESAQSARVAAEVANRAKSELIAGMSSEVTVPLREIGVVSDHLESLLLGAGTEQQVEDVQAIQRNYRHLVGLMDNLRHFATLEASEPSRSR